MKKLFYLLSLLLAVLLVSCSSAETDKVETGTHENISPTSATLKGAVNVDIAIYNSIEFGIMYDSSLEEVKNRSAHKVTGRVLHGTDFSVDVTSLTAKTKYYYCAYVLLNNMQYEYGALKSFTTLASGSKQSSNPANGHAYVDLGLSVKWATCNVGANTPAEYGDYFAWGETKPKESYDWSTYKWCNGSYDNLTKYCTDSNYGKVDNKTVLDLADDAAHVNWGGAWRMPTLEEQQELLDNCTWTWTTQNEVNGYLVTSKKNGNSIFLPAAGYHNSDSDLNVAGSYGYYWGRSLSTSYPRRACILGLHSFHWYLGGTGRGRGQSVRPVLP